MTNKVLEKIEELTRKIDELESIQNNMVRSDLFNRNFRDYLDSFFSKQKYYLYDLLRETPHEHQTQIKRRVFSALKAPHEHPINLIHSILRILLLKFNDICHNNSLTYWFELTSLIGAIKVNDIQPGQDHATVGMPLSDITKLIGLTVSDLDFFVETSFSHTRNGYIKLYRFKLRKTGVTWIDLFSYHYADSDTINSKKAYWNQFLGLKNDYAKESQMYQDIYNLNPNLPDGRDIIVQKYINLQDEMISPKNESTALFWGIENFTYGKPNILNCSKLFPLTKVSLWGADFTAYDSNAYLIGERNINPLALPNLDFGRIHKMQQHEEEYLKGIIAEYECQASVNQ